MGNGQEGIGSAVHGRLFISRRITRVLCLALLAAVPQVRGQRINQEGRILGPAPSVATPILFNTSQADAVVSALQIFPVTNPWNEDVSRRPVQSNSVAMIAQIKSDLSSSRQTLRAFYEMNYVLVPDAQARVSIPFLDYPDESDLDGGTFPNGLYPIPSNMPIETWPQGTGGLTLQQWQVDVNNTGGDRHGIMVAPGVGSIWETWQMKLTSNGWQASNGAKFSLNSNALRTAGWTSGDAAGLPMFPALVRYDECERGMVEHALRIVVAKSRREYIYPANHYASSIPASSVNYPAMGQRVRLKASFVIPAGWSTEEKAVLKALKKYGALVADNGNFFSFSVCPDDRFSSTAFDNISTVGIDNFEVVQATGPNEGPRSPGAPSVNAGSDQNVVGLTTNLSGTVNDPSGVAVIQWSLYSGPAPVTFANSSVAATMVTFGQTGTYVFMLSADDAVHAVAYDALTVNVQNGASPTPTPTPSPTPTPTPTPTPSPTPTPTPSPTPGNVTVSVSASPTQVREGNDGSFVITASPAPTRSLSIGYTMGGRAQPGVDYTGLAASGQITLLAGQTTVSVTFHAVADHRSERNEAAVMSLRTGTGYTWSHGGHATVTIVNVP